MKYLKIVSDVCKTVSGDHLGIHAHNDTGNAIANSSAAVQSGVVRFTTLNGIGERCGNANLITLIPTLLLKERFNKNFNTYYKRLTKEYQKNKPYHR